MIGMNAFLFDPHPLPLSLVSIRPSKSTQGYSTNGRGGNGEEMNTQTESKPSETAMTTENPMQERHCVEVIESFEVTAEAAFMARRLEAKGEAGPIFVP
jgi:hypothetical protein